MMKLENISEDAKTSILPRIKGYDFICKYDPKRSIARTYYKTYCKNCKDGKIRSSSRLVSCNFYKD